MKGKRKAKKSYNKPGMAPGTVQFTGEKRIEAVKMSILDYDEHHIEEMVIHSIEDCKPYIENPSKTWVKIQGLHDTEALKSIFTYFELHPLIQEDIVNTGQRPKVDHYENCSFFVLRMLSYHPEEEKVDSEQVSIVVGKNYVLSFKETKKPIFDPVIERLNLKHGRIRKLGVDYLGYALIDNIVDHYFNLLETLEDHIESVEDELLDDPDEVTFRQIHHLRKKVVFIRKSIWPLRDVLNTTIRDDSPFVRNSTKVYLRDVYDHIVQIIDNIENYRDVIMGMHDMYMSYVSNKMNEVMKVLTIIATIFIPLTFIAGIYGMNFDHNASPYNMPELTWYWGYPAAWGVMIIVAVIMVIYFKRKGWF